MDMEANKSYKDSQIYYQVITDSPDSFPKKKNTPDQRKQQVLVCSVNIRNQLTKENLQIQKWKI